MISVRFAGHRAVLFSAVSAAAMTVPFEPAFAQGAINAQDDDPAIVGEAAPSISGERNGDIIVTARRREERVQDTPLAVSAIPAEEIENLNITRLEGLEKMAPSLRVSTASGSGNSPAIFIRGIGTITTALYAEPAVGVYIDGVYSPRGSANTFDIPDVSSIEVLRGPQGTLFGRNTTGGAVVVNTLAPSPDAGVKAKLQYGSDNEMLGGLVLQSGYLGDTDFGIKLSGQVHTRDGWVETPGYGEAKWGGALEAKTVGLAVSGSLGPLRLDERLRYNDVSSYNSWEGIGGSANGVAFFGGGTRFGGPPFLLNDVADDLSYRDPRAGNDGESSVEAWINSFTATLELSDAIAIKSITGHIWLDQDFAGNLGGGYTIGPVLNRADPAVPVEIVSPHTTTANPGRARQFTQELQLLGDLGQFDYILGAYYFRERTNERIATIINFPVAPVAAIRLDTDKSYEILSKSYAAYGQVGWRPAFAADKLEITAGLRYTEDKKTLDSENTTITFAPAITTQTSKDRWDNTGWSTSISYKATPDVLFYGRASSSYRSGGYNAPTVGAPPFGPETAKSYELGLKSDLFNRLVRFNAAIFQTDYDDLQVNAYNSVTFSNTITNAGKARYRGFEVEAGLDLGAFAIDGNVGYVDPEYKEYLFLVGGDVVDVADEARFSNVSKWTYRIGAEYSLPTGIDGELTLRADYSAKSSPPGYTVAASTPNFQVIESLGRDENLSARLIWRGELAGAGVSAQIFGENLTDHRSLTFATDFSSIVSGVYTRPRHYGVVFGIEL